MPRAKKVATKVARKKADRVVVPQPVALDPDIPLKKQRHLIT